LAKVALLVAWNLGEIDMSSLLIHVPHSSVVIPSDVRTEIILNDAELDAEISRMTDWFTDELAPDLPCVKYMFSRLVVDPERFRDVMHEPMERVGMGAVYTKTSHGSSLRGVISREQRAHLLSKYYDTHHRLFEEAVSLQLKEHNRCTIIDLHSSPSKPLPYETNQSLNRPDICIGTDEFHTGHGLEHDLVKTFLSHGLSVDINFPFSGSFTPSKYYKADSRVQSIMIEINRSLYMDEVSVEKLSAFDAVKEFLSNAICKLAVETTKNGG